MKKIKHCNKLARELTKQGCRLKEKKNNVLLLPPLGADAQAYTWHYSDQHIGSVVDFIKKNYAHVLDLTKLPHRRFR